MFAAVVAYIVRVIGAASDPKISPDSTIHARRCFVVEGVILVALTALIGSDTAQPLREVFSWGMMLYVLKLRNAYFFAVRMVLWSLRNPDWREQWRQLEALDQKWFGRQAGGVR